MLESLEKNKSEIVNINGEINKIKTIKKLWVICE